MRFIFPIYLFQIYPIIYFLKALHSVYIEQFITVYPDFKASIDSPELCCPLDQLKNATHGAS